jgi:hypothetical protein
LDYVLNGPKHVGHDETPSLFSFAQADVWTVAEGAELFPVNFCRRIAVTCAAPPAIIEDGKKIVLWQVLANAHEKPPRPMS